HRTRNLLAVTQAIALKTVSKSRTLGEFQQEFDERLRALSRVQVLITGVDYGNVDLRDLLTAELDAHTHEHARPGQVALEGPAMPLSPGAAQALGLALHELVTNAAKYGALAQPGGRLSVRWRLRPRHGRRSSAFLEWKES